MTTEFFIRHSKTYLNQHSELGEKPIDEAYEKSYLYFDQHWTKDPSEYATDMEYTQRYWFGVGINHRVEDELMARDIPKIGWFVKIDNLEGLISLMQKYGPIVVRQAEHIKDTLEMEIFDADHYL
jgi:hypothetical protein